MDAVGGVSAPTGPGEPTEQAADGASHAELLRLAIPNVLSNLSVPLLGVVDTALVGRLDGLGPLGAVAVGAACFQILYWGFAFLRMSTTGLVAQAFGRGETEEGERLLARALFFALGAAALLLLFQDPLGELAFRVLQAPAEVLPEARAYYDVRIWAAPATLSTYALHGWFLGMQDARTPLAMVVVSNLVNAILDYVFVRHFGWGVAGVAWAGLIGQVLGLLLGWLGFRRATGAWLPRVSWAQLVDPEGLRRFASLGGDLVVRSACMLGTITLFMSRSGAAGTLTLAVNGVLMNLWSLHAYFVDGLAYAAESLVGKDFGRGGPAALRATVRRLMIWGVGVSLLLSGAYAVAGREILGVFTDKPLVIEAALGVFAWTILMPPINGVAFVWDGVYLGATRTRALRNAMLLCCGLVFLPAVFLCEHLIGGPHDLWMALSIWEVSRVVILGRWAEREVYAAQ